MNNEDIKKITILLIKVIEDNINSDGTLFKTSIDDSYINSRITLGGLCGLALYTMSKYNYSYDNIDKYIDAISIYTNTSDNNYWFPICNFNIRLSFLKHVESCLTRNVVEQFIVPE